MINIPNTDNLIMLTGELGTPVKGSRVDLANASFFSILSAVNTVIEAPDDASELLLETGIPLHDEITAHMISKTTFIPAQPVQDEEVSLPDAKFSGLTQNEALVFSASDDNLLSTSVTEPDYRTPVIEPYTTDMRGDELRLMPMVTKNAQPSAELRHSKSFSKDILPVSPVAIDRIESQQQMMALGTSLRNPVDAVLDAGLQTEGPSPPKYINTTLSHDELVKIPARPKVDSSISARVDSVSLNIPSHDKPLPGQPTSIVVQAQSKLIERTNNGPTPNVVEPANDSVKLPKIKSTTTTITAPLPTRLPKTDQPENRSVANTSSQIVVTPPVRNSVQTVSAAPQVSSIPQQQYPQEVAEKPVDSRLPAPETSKSHQQTDVALKRPPSLPASLFQAMIPVRQPAARQAEMDLEIKPENQPGLPPKASSIVRDNSAKPPRETYVTHAPSPTETVPIDVKDPSSVPEIGPQELRSIDTTALVRQDAAINRPEVMRHVAQQLADAARQTPDRPIELALNPEELGRVRLTFTTTDGGIHIAVMAERGETLDLLRRHIDTLAQEFRELGYRDVKFDFTGNGTRSDANASGNESADQDKNANLDTTDPDIATPIELSLEPSAGLDLRL